MQMNPPVPSALGEYRPFEYLGRGGMSDVWLASSPRLIKPCVLKILRPQLARDQQCRSRFRREAEIGAGLGHGRIVPVFDFGEEQGHLYLVMNFVDGIDLESFCRALEEGGERLPIAAVGYIIGEVFEALRHAHNRTMYGRPKAVIHRDVTPHNVLISSDGEVFLTDFGIARYEAEVSNETFGTLKYMAPEQARGQTCFASDIYGAAGVLHFMLTGQAPRRIKNAYELERSLDAPPPLTGRSDVPEPLERLRMMGLMPQLAMRLRSVTEALGVLDQWSGYRNTMRIVAQFYERYIGKPRSGVSGMMPAAESPEKITLGDPVDQEVSAPSRESAKMTVKVSPNKSAVADVEGREDETGAGRKEEERDPKPGSVEDSEPREREPVGEPNGSHDTGTEDPGEDDEDEDTEWGRPWWPEEPEDPLESCSTQRFDPLCRAAEADAPQPRQRPRGGRPHPAAKDAGSPPEAQP